MAAIGHTDATYDVARAALDAGARAPAPTCSTRCAGCTTASRARSRRCSRTADVHVELVADGVHVHPSVLALAARAKPDRVVLVTDAMAAAAAADGDYRLGRLEVARARGGRAPGGHRRDRRVDADHGPRGARTPSDVAGLPLARRRPRGVAGTRRAPRARRAWAPSTPGSYADLVVLDDTLEVRRVMRRGAWVA